MEAAEKVDWKPQETNQRWRNLYWNCIVVMDWGLVLQDWVPHPHAAINVWQQQV
jgi:hypothetical protein